MKIYLFRLSLTERGGPSLFEQADDRFSRPSRTDFLVQLFTREWDFLGHGGKRLKYGVAQQDGEIISGVVGRWITEEKEGDPTDLWTTVEQNHWEKAAIFLNLNPHDQVIGLEWKSAVGSPASLLKSLVTSLNEKAGAPAYKIEFFAVSSKAEFWTAVEQCPAPITSLALDLVIPNPSDASGATARALKRLRKRLNADRYKGRATNKDGLNVHDSLVKDAVQYVAAGGGEIVAKSDEHVVYDSRNFVATAEVDELARPTGGIITRLADMLAGKLKR